MSADNVRAGGDEERPAQQSVFDGTQLGACSVLLALVDLVGAEQLGQGVVVTVVLLDPRAGHGGELVGAVGLFDVDVSGPCQQRGLGRWEATATGPSR